MAKRYKEGTDKTIEILSFSDYREPNEALLSGDIDINAFQHKKFLSQFNEEGGSDIVAIGDTSIETKKIVDEASKESSIPVW